MVNVLIDRCIDVNKEAGEAYYNIISCPPKGRFPGLSGNGDVVGFPDNPGKRG